MNAESTSTLTPLIGRNEIYRFSKNPKVIKTVLIVGNGAVNGGWSPLAHALGCPTVTDGDTIAAFLAGYSFTYRDIKNRLLIGIGEEPTQAKATYDKFKEELYMLAMVREQVGNAFDSAFLRGKITLNECEPIKLLLANPIEIGVINTNWDRLLWSQPIPNIIQLHGMSPFPQSLIFPSELGTDEHIFDLARSAIDNQEALGVVAQMTGHYRGTMKSALRNAHGIAAQWLREATEIIVWGSALNAYDAELLTLLKEWSIEKPKHQEGCVTIINPNALHRERAAVILAAPEWTRRDFDPVNNQWG
jgi:hypothetical protein